MCDEYLVEVCIWADGTWCEKSDYGAYVRRLRA